MSMSFFGLIPINNLRQRCYSLPEHIYLYGDIWPIIWLSCTVHTIGYVRQLQLRYGLSIAQWFVYDLQFIIWACLVSLIILVFYTFMLLRDCTPARDIINCYMCKHYMLKACAREVQNLNKPYSLK